MQLQIAAKPSDLCCHLANTNDKLGGLATASDSAFCQITLVLVICIIIFKNYLVLNSRGKKKN